MDAHPAQVRDVRLGTSRHDSPDELVGDLGRLGVDEAGVEREPIDCLGYLALGHGVVDLVEPPVARAWRRDFVQLLHELQSPDASFAIEEAVDLGLTIPELPTVGPHDLVEVAGDRVVRGREVHRRAKQALVRPVEELGDVVVLVPRLRRRQVAVVFGLERLLLLGVLEQVLADHVRHRVLFAGKAVELT